MASDAPATAETPRAAHDAVVRGRLWVALAAVMWSSSGLFAKATTFEVWPTESRGLVLAFWRALFAGVLLLPAVRRPQWDSRLIPLCVTFAVMNVMYLSSMTLTTAANAIWLQSTAPWWVFLVGVVVLREPFPRTERIPLVIGGLGMAIILWYELAGQAQVGVLLGLISGFAYAGVVLSLRALRGLETFWIVAVAHLVTAAAIFPSRGLCRRLAQPRPVAGPGRIRLVPDGLAVCLLRPRSALDHVARSHGHWSVGAAFCCRCGCIWPGAKRRRRGRWSAAA